MGLPIKNVKKVIFLLDKSIIYQKTDASKK